MVHHIGLHNQRYMSTIHTGDSQLSLVHLSLKRHNGDAPATESNVSFKQKKRL